MILRKRFKTGMAGSRAVTKCREPLNKFMAEMAKTVSWNIAMNSHHCLFLLSNCRYRLLCITSGIHQATSTSNRNMGAKVPKVHQHEHFPVIWKIYSLLMVLRVHVEKRFRNAITNLPHVKRILCAVNTYNTTYFIKMFFKLWNNTYYQL